MRLCNYSVNKKCLSFINYSCLSILLLHDFCLIFITHLVSVTAYQFGDVLKMLFHLIFVTFISHQDFIKLFDIINIDVTMKCVGKKKFHHETLQSLWLTWSPNKPVDSLALIIESEKSSDNLPTRPAYPFYHFYINHSNLWLTILVYWLTHRNIHGLFQGSMWHAYKLYPKIGYNI